MVALGIHMALTDAEVAHLLGLSSDEEKYMYLNELDEHYDQRYVQDTEHAWDPIHRCLGDFPPNTEYFYAPTSDKASYALPEDHGSPPLKWCILGGKRVSEDDRFAFIRLIEPQQVEALAEAMAGLDEAWLRDKYFEHCRGAWPEFGEDDFGYTLGHFEELRDWFARMAGNGRSVVFSADQ